jgi:outer membrane receptor protein involved in Fe transport
VSEAAATVRTISLADIVASGARTLDEALALLPGVEVRTGAGGIPRLNVRGFRSRHLLLLLDGIPLNSTFDGQADPSLIPVEQIAAIKLTPGTGSVLYGQGGLGGVVNIITRRGGAAPAVEGAAEWRDGDAWLRRATLSGGARGADFFVSASASESDGYPTVRGSPSLGASPELTRPNSGRRRANLFVSATSQPSPRLMLGFVAAAVRGAFGIPPNAINDATDRYANRPVFERVDDLGGVSSHVAATYAPSGDVSVRAWAYFNRLGQERARYDDSTYSSMDDPTVRGTYRERSHTRLTGAAAQVGLQTHALGRFSLGLSAERDGWDADISVRDVSVSASGGGGGKGGGGGSAVKTYAVRAVSDARAVQRYAVALENEFRPSTRTGVVLGYARHWLEKDSAGRDGTWAASAGAYADVTPHTRLRVAAARNVRFPTIRQLYDEDGGDPALRTERSTTAELGIEQSLAGATRVALTAFRTYVRDYIERPASDVPFSNNDSYRFAGIEASAEVTVRSAMLRGRYTYLDTEDRSPGSARGQLQYRPRHRASIEGRYGFAFGLSASVSALRVSDQVYYSRQEPITSRRLPDYTLASARLQQSLAGGIASLYAGVDNLFDERYEEEYGSPQATRVIYAGLTIRRR